MRLLQRWCVSLLLIKHEIQIVIYSYLQNSSPQSSSTWLCRDIWYEKGFNYYLTFQEITMADIFSIKINKIWQKGILFHSIVLKIDKNVATKIWLNEIKWKAYKNITVEYTKTSWKLVKIHYINYNDSLY